jgi:REP element-mobilizing transposase RayT
VRWGVAPEVVAGVIAVLGPLDVVRKGIRVVGTLSAVHPGMVHPYPRYCASFGYVGRHCYLLTFVTFRRIEVLRKAGVVDLVWTQILRAAREQAFEVLAASFMPDHLHMVVEGMGEDSDLKRFAKAAKQYSGYYHAQAHGEKLWQKGNDDIIVRDSADLRARPIRCQ